MASLLDRKNKQIYKFIFKEYKNINKYINSKMHANHQCQVFEEVKTTKPLINPQTSVHNEQGHVLMMCFLESQPCSEVSLQQSFIINVYIHIWTRLMICKCLHTEVGFFLSCVLMHVIKVSDEKWKCVESGETGRKVD